MSKNRKILGISSIAIFVVALAVMLMDWFIPLNLLFHPAANFAAILFLGFGIMTLVLAFRNKSPWFLFLSAILVGLCLLYVLLYVLLPDWWIAVVVVVAVWAIYAILSVTLFGNKTEAIALNKSPEYKNYEQRKAEKEEAEANKEEEPLPELKSFK
ncbi:MAG: hypothetical protein E7362_03765 [Clostridiales bacterium]|nr:hypothetical protein [Clostridiales bacterium]